MMLNEIRVKYILNSFFKMMMLNMFHYQLNQNTSCDVKFVVDTNKQPKRSTDRRQSEQPFYMPQVYPCITVPMMLG